MTMLPSTKMRELTVLLVCATAAATATAACGSSSSPALLGNQKVVTASPPSQADLVAFSRLTNAIPTEISADGSTAYGVVDSGNPWVLLDPAAFPTAATLPANGGPLDAITAGGLTRSKPYVIPTSTGDVSGDATLTLRGNLGCSVLCGQVASFDYRAVTFTLGDTPPTDAPTDLGATLSVPFTLSGGGSDEGVPIPASRVVVPVVIEGTTFSMIVDTGASDVILSADAYNSIVADGRVQTDGGMSQTTTGTSDSSITRVRSIVVGDATVERPVIGHDAAFDANIAEVSADVGHTIDGSLGGTFLRNYYVTLDYPNLAVNLAPYPDTSFLLDQGEMIGIAVEDVGGGYLVSEVSTAAAAAGVNVGDVVLSIDGQDLASISPLQVATLFYGTVGTTKKVTFGAAAMLDNQSIDLTVEEMLPLANPR
jgi:hypothetical protein